MRFTWAPCLSLSRFLWMACFPLGVLIAPHRLVSPVNLRRMQSIPLLMSLTLKSTSFRTDPTDTTCYQSQSEHWAIDHFSLGTILQPAPYPSINPPIKSISSHFGEKDVMGDYIKSLTEIQIDGIGCFSLVHSNSYAIIKTDKVGQREHVLHEAMMPFLYYFLFVHVP